MGYIDPAEGDAITEAFNWAQDHGFVSEYSTVDALAEAVTRLAPTYDPSVLKAHITDFAATDGIGIYVLGLAPPSDRLPAGTWRGGPITAGRRPGQPGGIVLLIICEPEYLARLRSGAR